MALRSVVFVVVLPMLAVPAVSRAQQTGSLPVSPPRVHREIRGFDFRKDGVWRRQGRAVRALRAHLLSRRNLGALNAPMAAGPALASAAAVSGVLKVPTILFKFKNTPASQLRTSAAYDQVLFGTTPPSGRPYTYRSFYEQMSNGLLSLQGNAIGYVTLDSTETPLLPTTRRRPQPTRISISSRVRSP